jgi:hypothetical protein
LRINPELANQRGAQEQAETARRRKCREFTRKKEQYERNISRGVNIPQLNADQMRRVKEGLSALFKWELNPILEDMMPRSDEHGEWVGFKRAYEECMHRTREHILLVIGQDSNRLYGERRLNPKLQAVTEQSTETMIGLQKVR